MLELFKFNALFRRVKYVQRPLPFMERHTRAAEPFPCLLIFEQD